MIVEDNTLYAPYSHLSFPVGFPLQVAYGAVDLKLSNGCCSSGEDENTVPASTQLHLRTLAERDARAMEAAARAMEEATNRMSEASRSTAPTSVTPIISLNHHHRSMLSSQKMEPPHKRMTLDEDRLAAHMGMPSAHLKITSRSKQHQYNIIIGYLYFVAYTLFYVALICINMFIFFFTSFQNLFIVVVFIIS